MVAQVSAACMFVPSAFLGKKIGRKRTVLLGVLLMVAGLAFGTALIFATSSAGVIKAAMYPVFIFVGAGWATINVHSFVMSVELATEQTTGAYTGLYYAFAMGAQATTPFFAGLCMDYIDPRALLPLRAHIRRAGVFHHAVRAAWQCAAGGRCRRRNRHAATGQCGGEPGGGGTFGGRVIRGTAAVQKRCSQKAQSCASVRTSVDFFCVIAVYF